MDEENEVIASCTQAHMREELNKRIKLSNVHKRKVYITCMVPALHEGKVDQYDR